MFGSCSPLKFLGCFPTTRSCCECKGARKGAIGVSKIPNHNKEREHELPPGFFRLTHLSNNSHQCVCVCLSSTTLTSSGEALLAVFDGQSQTLNFLTLASLQGLVLTAHTRHPDRILTSNNESWVEN